MAKTWIQGSQGERYLVRQELGRGAMGLVLLADEAPSGRRVVLKILLAAASGAGLERFTREGEVAGRLSHPGIVPIHGVGRLLDGRPYLCFAHVEGARDLQQEFLEAPLETRLEWLMEAGAALGHAHQQGIVHRDLKLANLLVDGGGRIRVADFGVALLSDQERLTQSGALVGTAHAMAPEQATGERGAIGPQSDVWALGVLLYLACAERYPFEGSNQVEVLQAIVRGQPKPLTDISRALSEVVSRALQRDPQRRFADGGEFADALELATLQGSERSRSPVLLLLGALVFTLVAGVAIGLALRPAPGRTSASPPASPTPTSSPSPSLSTAPAASPSPAPENPAQLLAEAKALAETGRSGVRGAYLRAAQAGSLEAQEYLSQRGPQPAREFWRKRAVEGGSASAAHSLAMSSLDDDPKQARSLFERAAKAGHRPAMFPLSQSLRDQRAGPVDSVAAERWAAEALRLGDPEALLAAGRLDYRQGRQAEGVERVRLAAAGDSGQAWIQLGRWQSKGWRGVPPDLNEAERSLRRALELEAPDAAGFLALVLHDHGKSLEAERLLKKRIQEGDRFAEAVWGRALYHFLGRKPEGLRLLRAAAAKRPAHPQSDFFFARVLCAEGQREEAFPLLESAVQAGVLEGSLTLAELYNRRGERGKAKEVLEGALGAGYSGAAIALSALASEQEERNRYMKEAVELHDATILVKLSQQAAQGKLLKQCRLLLERAVASGDSTAHLLLASLLAGGAFGAPEPQLAERHWLEAARRRRVEGAVGLAKWVAERPESPHLAEAKRWLEAACLRGDGEALALKRSLGW